VIRLEAVSKTFGRGDGGRVTALRDLTLEVARGETLALLGPSGCGKTTTLRLVNRLVEPDTGRVLVGGEDVAGLDPIRLRRRIGYVVQAGGLFPHLTVAQNVGLLCRLEGWSDERVAGRAAELLGRVHLAPERFADRFPHELSGGQRQRVGVARALALDPEIVLMDEPFGALDPITRFELQGEFLELKGQVEKTVVFVTHDVDEAFRVADRIALFAEGVLAQTGSAEELRSRPASSHVERFLAGAPLRGEA